ncbi:ribulose-phosphate 3-epimerase [Candidatus Riesia pediculicola]|uniref:Ribulose-phosphate 3-epimerase n=1 Tax=Riesia pediculicola (strain USDA) TaxID=515618 RepID=D4G8W0_RIEPU|nr:ribulose-phosphate 3-epimerase [Candidatus Riesia pediculicola]ADD79647.1 ribulose-phosphate 3-epimerase [Candidatus Riesia pediculicola USDA]ARC53971.1 ribulose phosphate epimerase [Candidatus Riesia pediculicola]QOJ86598.1 ribulose-phosphate 3-epimerase [Candidatus Riesia pediculicola]
MIINPFIKRCSIAISILSANLASLGKDIAKLVRSGLTDIIHFDIMDNHYVPNLTFGPILCKSLIEYGIQSNFHIHLMTDPSERLIREFIELGVHQILLHVEEGITLKKELRIIRENGCKAGIVFNPKMSLEILTTLINEIDSVLIMSVNPGFGGQSFIENSIKRLLEARSIIDRSGKDILLGVDGGINLKNLKKIVETGVDILVIGSAIFNRSRNYVEILNVFRKKIDFYQKKLVN